MTRFPLIALLLTIALAACGDGGSDPPELTDTGVGSDTTASDDTGTSAGDTGSGGENQWSWPVADVPGPCVRTVTDQATGDLQFTVYYDWGSEPGRVFVEKRDPDEVVLETYRFDGVDTTSSCVKPPEEINYPFIDLAGCPTDSRSDLDGDGQTSPQDRKLAYFYTSDGTLENVDIFTDRNVATGERYTFTFATDSATAERRNADGVAGTVRYEPTDAGFDGLFDRDGDGAIEERRVYTVDPDNGRVIRSERATLDVVSGEFRAPLVSDYDYSCF